MNNCEKATRKQELRKQMSAWREHLCEKDVQAQSAVMAGNLLRLIQDNHEYFKSRQKTGSPCVGLYNAFRQEADFSSVWYDLQQAGWELSFPIMLKNDDSDSFRSRGLKFIMAPRIDAADLKLSSWFVDGHFGVHEPPADHNSIVEPDLIILPGLAFDRQGNRLGWGKAYYDSYLASRGADVDSDYPVTLGAALEGQLIDDVPSAEHDIALCGLITPSGVILTDSCFVELFI